MLKANIILVAEKLFIYLNLSSEQVIILKYNNNYKSLIPELKLNTIYILCLLLIN
jgi:hypothetical protein